MHEFEAQASSRPERESCVLDSPFIVEEIDGGLLAMRGKTGVYGILVREDPYVDFVEVWATATSPSGTYTTTWTGTHLEMEELWDPVLVQGAA